jgi:hypothetical protein
MIIKRPDKSAHWYLRDGTPYYEVPKLDGTGMRPATVRDAFKAGAYRSVTNVLSILDKPGLDYWKQEQTVLSALTLPRLENEEEHSFAERVIVDADEQAKKARETGTRLHELAANWLQFGTVPVAEERNIGDSTPTSRDLIAPFQQWCLEHLDTANGLVMPPESVMVNHNHGYAGRVDFPLRMKDGSIAIVDAKTQDVKRSPKGEPKPEYYDEWALQLAAYSRCIFADGSYPPPMPWRLISLVIDRTQPGVYTHEWTDPTNPLTSSERHFMGFTAACRLWTYLKGGTPGIDAKKAA